MSTLVVYLMSRPGTGTVTHLGEDRLQRLNLLRVIQALPAGASPRDDQAIAPLPGPQRARGHAQLAGDCADLDEADCH